MADELEKVPKHYTREAGLRSAEYLRGRRKRAIELQAQASAEPVDLMRSAGFRIFSTVGEMIFELKKEVKLKIMRQAHEAELAEPGDPPTSGIVGVAEW